MRLLLMAYPLERNPDQQQPQSSTGRKHDVAVTCMQGKVAANYCFDLVAGRLVTYMRCMQQSLQIERIETREHSYHNR
jgi:hypothetical protein